MKKFAILAVLAALSAAASATQPIFGGDTTNNYDQRTYNTPSAVGNGYGGAGGQGGAGGAGGRGGDGGNATVLGSGNSSNTNLNSNMQGQVQGQAQSLRNNIANTNTSGSASGASASNGGNTTGSQSVHVEGDVTNIPRQAPAVSVGAPSQPITSCRLGISLGGSSAGGAGAGGIPIGNDATCLAGAQLAAMDKAGGFSVEDKQKAACGIEGMAIMSVCKKLYEPVRAAAVAAPAVVTAKNEPSDPFVRARLGLPALK